MLTSKSICLDDWLQINQQAIDATEGTALPAWLRAKMEAFFATRFDDVRIKLSPLIADLGVAAATCGSTLLVDPSHYDPHSLAGQVLIGHELAHVVQQRQRRVPVSTSASLHIDPWLEDEADRLGLLAALSSDPRPSDPRPSAPSSSPDFAPQPTLRAQAPLVFQPKIEILDDAKASPSDKDAKRKIVKSVSEATQAMRMLSDEYRAVLKEQRDYFNRNNQGCIAILQAWIDEGGYDVFGLLAMHTRTYRDYGELLRAVVAEHAAKANLAKENRLAQETYQSDRIKTNMAKALKAVYTKIMSINDKDLKNKILGELDGFSCAYGYFYRTTWSCRNIASYIQDPNKEYLDCNVAIYHDLMQYFILDENGQPIKRFPTKTAGHALDLREDERFAMGTYEEIGITDEEWENLGDKNNIDLDEVIRRGRRATFKKVLGDDYRNKLSTANEDKLITQGFREKNLPMWASHSWTTLRMLVLANWASGPAKLKHHQAIAWSIFALWNDSTTLQLAHPIHRFHEVMDIASNFGVPYQHLRYPDHAPA